MRRVYSGPWEPWAVRDAGGDAWSAEAKEAFERLRERVVELFLAMEMEPARPAPPH